MAQQLTSLRSPLRWFALALLLVSFVDIGCLGGVGAFRTKPIDEILAKNDASTPQDQTNTPDVAPPAPDRTNPTPEPPTPDNTAPDPKTPDQRIPDAAPDMSQPDQSTPEPRPEPQPEPRPEPQPEPQPEPPPACQYQFCEDFESYVGKGLDAKTWRKEVNGKASVSIATGKSRSGKASLKFQVNESSYNNRAFAFFQKWTTRKVFYARYWAYIDRLPRHTFHTTLFETGGTAKKSGVFGGNPFTVVLRYGVQNNEHLMYNSDTPGYYNNGKGPGSDCWKHSTTKLPANKWVCVEWFYDANQKKSTLWLNSKQILTMGTTMQGCVRGGVDPNKKEIVFPSDFKWFRLGYVTYKGGDTSQHILWVDDVAIHNQRIGCQ